MEDGGDMLTLVLGAGAALSGAVTVLFKIVMKQSDEQITLSQKVGKLEGRQDGIKSLSEQVLQTVHEAIEDKDSKS